MFLPVALLIFTIWSAVTNVIFDNFIEQNVITFLIPSESYPFH
jgi:hypothetical protein